MGAKIYILNEGTCKVNPFATRNFVYGKLTGRIPSVVTGGPTVAAIWAEECGIVYDSGDTLDRTVLEKNIGARKPDYVVAGHTHPDHFANNDMFPAARWFYPIGDEALESVLTGTGEYAKFSGLYQGLPEASRDTKKFERLDPAKLPEDWPELVDVIETDGHMIGHQSLVIRSADTPIEVNNIASAEKSEEKTVVLAGDAIISKDYVQRFFKGDYRHAAYNISFYDGTPREQTQRGKEIGSMARLFELVGDDGLIVPGHGKPFRLSEVRKNG